MDIGEFKTVFDGCDNDDFWAVCDDSGRITVCSEVASQFGITAGESFVQDMIHKRDILKLEDALQMGNRGGEVSVLLTASEDTGHTVASFRRADLFSSFSGELRLYKDKSEYLADLSGNRMDISKVFSCMYEGTERINSALRNVLVEVADEASLFDPSELFDKICEDVTDRGASFFRIDHRNDLERGCVMCLTDAKRFVGVTLMMMSVALKISRGKNCEISLSATDDYVIIDAQCDMSAGFLLFGKSCEFCGIYELLRTEPMDVIVLERMASFPEWNVEYTADENGNFVFRALLERNVDTDRLKYRDSIPDVGDVICNYLDYINAVQLLDSEEQSENK